MRCCRTHLKPILVCSLLLSGIVSSKAQNLAWAKGIGGGGTANTDGYNNIGNDIIADAAGNVYTVGTFSGTADFDPGPGTNFIGSVLQSDGMAATDDIFILKQDTLGNLIWARSIGGNHEDKGLSIGVDAIGNVYVSGTFQDTADFDPGMGTYKLVSNGGDDIFITKLDNDGNFVWARQIGGSDDDGSILSIALDAGGNIYTTGIFSDTVDFDPGINTVNLISAGLTDVFVSKMDNAGNLIWAKQMGGVSSDISKSVAVDHSGNILVTGGFFGTADYDPGPGNTFLTSLGGMDIFVVKLNSSGDLIWVKQMGGSDGLIDRGESVTTDAFNNVYTSGSFAITGGTGSDFDPGPATFNLDPQFGKVFVSKLDSSGNFVWAKQIGNASNSYANGVSLAVDEESGIYTIGLFTDTADFDPGVGTSLLISNSPNGDAFISKLDTAGNFVWAKQIRNANFNSMAIKSIASDNANNIYTTGSFRMEADFDPGEDTFNLYSVIPGNADVFIQKLSCSSSDSIFVASCGPYATNEQLYTQTGVYTQAFFNKFGCDSIVYLNLTITSIDTSVIQNGSTLTTVNTGANFQWVNCDDYTPVAGAINQNFTSTIEGRYAVIITLNDCVDTSACYTIKPTGIMEQDFSAVLQIYPNPTYGQLSITANRPLHHGSFCVMDLMGQIVMKDTDMVNSEYTLDITRYMPGIYFIKIKEGLRTAYFKLVKE